ncbi:AAA family ATPase [Patescibacteria group bacterium]|nr:AAA family ATPase [Patescibacteria group bacterium]
MITIGITGTIGAGKGTVVEYLKTQGFKHFSAREFLIKEVKKRGLELVRHNITDVANNLRKQYFPGYIISELLKRAEQYKGNRVIESIRTLGEIELLRQNGKNFYLFAVNADLNLRYERVVERHSITDNVSYDKFVEDEKREYESAEPWSQNLKGCIAQADYVFDNNGTVEELYKKIEDTIQKLA